MTYDAERTRAAIECVDAAARAGTLTKELFVEAYRELAAALGDGPEAEGIEAILNYAEDESWVFEAER